MAMLLEFKDVDTYYGDLHALKKVNYTIEKGEIVALLGGNASGKSTTMKTIMGVVRPTRGQVIFDGQSIGNLPTGELECLRFILDDLGWDGYLGFFEEGRDSLHIGCAPSAREFFTSVYQEAGQ